MALNIIPEFILARELKRLAAAVIGDVALKYLLYPSGQLDKQYGVYRLGEQDLIWEIKYFLFFLPFF